MKLNLLSKAAVDDKGFSLVELVVAAGIMGIVLLGATSMFQTLMQMSSRVEAKQDVNSLTLEVQASMIRRNLCTAALVPGQVFDLNQASIAHPTVDPNSKGMPFQFNLSDGSTLISGGELDNYRLKIESLTLNGAICATSDCAATPIYKVALYGIFTAKGSIVGNSTFSPKKMASFLVELDGSDVIVGCYSSLSNDSLDLQAMVDSLTELLCARFGGTYDGATKMCSGFGGGGGGGGGGVSGGSIGDCLVAPPGSGSRSGTGRYPSGSIEVVNGGCSGDTTYLCVTGTWAPIAHQDPGCGP